VLCLIKTLVFALTFSFVFNAVYFEPIAFAFSIFSSSIFALVLLPIFSFAIDTKSIFVLFLEVFAQTSFASLKPFLSNLFTQLLI